jgi:hypothetical protein
MQTAPSIIERWQSPLGDHLRNPSRMPNRRPLAYRRATVVTADTSEFKRIRGLKAENWLA